MVSILSVSLSFWLLVCDEKKGDAKFVNSISDSKWCTLSTWAFRFSLRPRPVIEVVMKSNVHQGCRFFFYGNATSMHMKSILHWVRIAWSSLYQIVVRWAAEVTFVAPDLIRHEIGHSSNVASLVGSEIEIALLFCRKCVSSPSGSRTSPLSQISESLCSFLFCFCCTPAWW